MSQALREGDYTTGEHASGRWPDVQELAGQLHEDPRWGLPRLDELRRSFMQRPADGRTPEDYFPVHKETRGGEEVAFTIPVYCGITPNKRFVMVVTDDSGYHRMVRIYGPDGYREPPVYDGSHRAEPGVMRVDFVRSDNPGPWLAAQMPGEFLASSEIERDSVIIWATESGERVCCIRDGLTGERIPVYGFDEVYGAVQECAAGNVVSLSAARRQRGLGRTAGQAMAGAAV